MEWRVDRRRRAWLPSDRFHDLPGFDAPDLLGLALMALLLSLWVLALIAGLLATAVVWPLRVKQDRWAVVASTRFGSDGLAARWVTGREAADSQVRQWAADIKEHGRPQVPQP